MEKLWEPHLFLFRQKKYQIFLIFWKKYIFLLRFFQINFCRIGQDWRALVKSRIPNMKKQRAFFLAEKKSKLSPFLFFFFFEIFYFFWHFLLLFSSLFCVICLDFLKKLYFFYFLNFFFNYFKIFLFDSKVTKVTTKILEGTTDHHKLH